MMTRKKLAAAAHANTTEAAFSNLLAACLCADLDGVLPEHVSNELLEAAGRELPDCERCRGTGLAPGEDPESQHPELCHSCLGLTFRLTGEARLQVLQSKLQMYRREAARYSTLRERMSAASSSCKRRLRKCRG
jgi:hypothetical protein